MDEIDKGQINPKRRFFLTAATAGSAIAVAAAVSARKEVVQEALPAAPVEPGTDVGYHETEHIRKYYATAAYL